VTSRRHFIKAAAGAGAGLFLPFSFRTAQALAPSTGLLDPLTQPKFVNRLPNPLAPSYIYQPTQAGGANTPALYDVQMEATTHFPGLVDPKNGRRLSTSVWAYSTPSQRAAYPGYTFEVRRGQTIKVRYSNQLQKEIYPADVPVDTTLHWADPLNLGDGPRPYTGPVPLVTHQHGGDTQSLSDGLPDAWSTPGGVQKGRLYQPVYTYDNRQEAAHLWYHDHAVGVTRLNVYMGLAGHYIIRDANEDALDLPSYPYEVALVIQDRTFLANGELFYAADGSAEEGYENAPPTTHLPENFGNVILVNGVAWPLLEVEPRKYRFRVLNGSDSRVYDLQLSNGAPFIQIGSDLGLLNHPVEVTTISVAPGERADVIVDFSRMRGQTIVVKNSANAPYPGGDPVDPDTTGKVMAFRVSLPKSGTPDARIPDFLRPKLGPVPVLSNPARVRKILLVEGTDPYGRLQTMLGIVDPSRPTLNGTLMFTDPISENPRVGDTEVWEFYNTTEDAHPIHMHLVDFRVINRQAFTGNISEKVNSDHSVGGVLDKDSIVFTGQARTPAAEERGKKDTAKMFPGEVTRVIVHFDRPGEFLYHCHILSHEDHEMMRPYYVGPIPAGR
jgi:spore coat protein A, manganese oxidase